MSWKVIGVPVGILLLAILANVILQAPGILLAWKVVLFSLSAGLVLLVVGRVFRMV